jgi:hypothetical protein
MNYSYEFDFGNNPGFLIDAWFHYAIRPIVILCLIFFPIAYSSEWWVSRTVLPAVVIGALLVFVGVYLFRRALAVRRVRGLGNTVFRYTIDDQGIHFDNELANGVLRWGFKGRLVRRKHLIMLQSSEVGLLPLPVDIPEEVLQGVKDRLLGK